MISRSLKYFYFILLVGAYRSDWDSECPDAEIGEICYSQCAQEYTKCLSDCKTSSCENECSSQFTECYSSCPCFRYCPSGCEGCPNSICLCMTKCPTDCSCKNGYSCQPHVTVICQSQAYNIENLGYASFNYIISADGEFKANRQFDFPQEGTNPYLEGSGNALLKGEIYFFGSITQSTKKIAKLSGCQIEDTKKQLINTFKSSSGSLTTTTFGIEAVILCHGITNSCESFDGETTKAISSTRVKHEFGCMAQYKEKPIMIGSTRSNQVEVLASSGWEDSVPHIHEIAAHTCISVDNGVLTIGGYLYDGPQIGNTKNVFLLRNEQWSNAGALIHPNNRGTSIHFGEFFLVFGGYAPNYVEKANWDGEKVTSSKVINRHDGPCIRPIIFESVPSAYSFDCKDYCYFYP